MIAFDTNALVRMVMEDDDHQAKIVQEVVTFAEENSLPILVLPEVIIETVWVLESVYRCTRKDICQFVELLTATSTFTLPDAPVIRNALRSYRQGGDFADLLILEQARKWQARKLFSFDKALQKTFPGYVVEHLGKSDL
jgi:predicted nucleic-acid-binding protein